MRLTSWRLIGLGYFFVTMQVARAAFVSEPTLLGSNDSVSWSQLGSAGSSVANSFSAISGVGLTVLGSLTRSTGGTVGEVCPAANCNYGGAPGFNAGDALLWSEDASGNGTGPVTLTFATPVRGAGLYLELTAPGTFTASFTKSAGANTSVEFPASNSNGDPLFVGALDPVADITGITIGILSCTPSSPGGCSASDFAVDSLLLTTVAAPEPAMFMPVLGALLLFALRRRRGFLAGVMGCCFLASFATVPARAQDPVPIPADEVALEDSTDAARALANIAPMVTSSAVMPALPIWRYQITSPANGFSSGGYMVGTSPFNRGARTTTVPVILVPFVVQFNNTTSGFSATFDPSVAPDAGCTAGQTALSLVENSPLFQNSDWSLNGVYVGNTQYVDAYQRANFWQYVQNTGNAYHTLLAYTVGAPLTLAVSYATPTASGEVRVGAQGTCTNAAVPGSTNGGSYQGVVDMTTLHNAMTNYITTHGITPDQFPIFILYNVMYSQNGLLYLGGYHFTGAPYPQALTSPGQTFALANFRTNGTGPFDISILSHEIAEWMDDPGGYNAAPAWGNVGELTGCSRYLEVGDPLTHIALPPIAGPNGFGYHLQELAFFSWFFRTPSIGAGGMFSDNGTFTTDAGSICQ